MRWPTLSPIKSVGVLRAFTLTMTESSKTSISLDRATYEGAQELRKQAIDRLGKNIKWDAVVEGFCEVATNNKEAFMTSVEANSRMAKLKCTICGEILGSVKEVERHFQNVHKTKEAYTIIE